MFLQDTLKSLSEFHKARASDFGIIRIGVFGSVACGNDTDDSDIDVVVELARPDLLILVAIKQELEEIFQRPVDIVRYRAKMNHLLKQRIEQDAVYV